VGNDRVIGDQTVNYFLKLDKLVGFLEKTNEKRAISYRYLLNSNKSIET